MPWVYRWQGQVLGCTLAAQHKDSERQAPQRCEVPTRMKAVKAMARGWGCGTGQGLDAPYCPRFSRALPETVISQTPWGELSLRRPSLTIVLRAHLGLAQ